MGWVEELRGKVVGLDTTPLIAFVEKQPANVELLKPFFLAVQNYEISVVTSTVTLLEVLVHPIRHGDAKLAQRYRDILLDAAGFTIINLNLVLLKKLRDLELFTISVHRILSKWQLLLR